MTWRYKYLKSQYYVAFRHFDRCRKIVGNKYSYRRFNTLSLKYFKVDGYFESLNVGKVEEADVIFQKTNRFLTLKDYSKPPKNPSHYSTTSALIAM